MNQEGLNGTAQRLAYEFYLRIIKKNHAAMLNNEQWEAEAEVVASANKRLFLPFAKMEQDVKILLANIDFMFMEGDANLDPDDKALIAQIKQDYK